ncbi:hypothetical protein Pyn_17371 [Prunus yedoensis var. nudiflora]|uniref:S-protein homolog n=1 Tax=Prunus yedoensis var. nudiflora TaxID=2094558 RepID=A0A314UYA7_PRUYE|nr:hypothetical protein Pyn_17371 [Prunus yedoensis var. nudiflora]
MEGKAMRQWYFLVLFLALAFALSICSGLPVMTKRFVRIVNLLDNKQLVYHCHSKDDDLGQRTLAPQQEWEFKFHLDFETIFTCDFWHSNNHHAHFDVFYPSNKFVHRCGGAPLHMESRRDWTLLISHQDWSLGKSLMIGKYMEKHYE